MQLTQAPAVTADAKVAIVAVEHLTQAFALQFKRPMPHEPALLIERLERTRKAVFRRELLHVQDFLVEDRPISPVEDHLTGSLAEPKATSLTLPFSCWQVCEP